jgi:hypothetical protein
MKYENRINKNDFCEIGIIEENVNKITKDDYLALFLFHHFSFCPICESTLELGLQKHLYVVKEIILS